MYTQTQYAPTNAPSVHMHPAYMRSRHTQCTHAPSVHALEAHPVYMPFFLGVHWVYVPQCALRERPALTV